MLKNISLPLSYGMLYTYIRIPGSKGLNPHELAHRWVNDLVIRPNIRISWDDSPTICEYWVELWECVARNNS